MDVIKAAEKVAPVAGLVIDTLVPVAEPFVTLILAIIKAHQNATNGQFPTPAQVQAALPADSTQLHSMWAAWSAKKGL